MFLRKSAMAVQTILRSPLRSSCTALTTVRRSVPGHRHYATERPNVREMKQHAEEEAPIKFSESPAFEYRPEQSFGTESDEQLNRLWFEPYVLCASMATFMIYFFYLREENDIDERLGSLTVEQQFRNYEISSLAEAIKKCESEGVDTTDMEIHMMELKELKAGVP